MTGTPPVPAHIQSKRSLRNFLLLLFILSVPCWVFGAMYDVELFPGFKLFQLPLGMPMIAALILIWRENGIPGVISLLKRTYDFRRIKPAIWFLLILFLFPAISAMATWLLQVSGTPIPAPNFSWVVFLGYIPVFFMTYGEELGLTGYAFEPMRERFNALQSGLLLGVVWAGYHIPGFIISGYFTAGWMFWHAVYIIVARVLFVWVYVNSGKSLFAMALLHWAFGLYWIMWPQDNLQKAVPFYDPRIWALLAVAVVATVVYVWGPGTLAKYRFAQTEKAKV